MDKLVDAIDKHHLMVQSRHHRDAFYIVSAATLIHLIAQHGPDSTCRLHGLIFQT